VNCEFRIGAGGGWEHSFRPGPRDGFCPVGALAE